MKIILKTLDDEVLLKKCTSYLDLDKTLSSFSSKKDMLDKLGLNEEMDEIIVLDNNGKQIDYDPDILRKTLSFYEKGKCEDFIEWIYRCNSELDLSKLNGDKLEQYFIVRLNTLEQEIKDGIQYKEGERLSKLIPKIIDDLSVMGNYSSYPKPTEDFVPLKVFAWAIIPNFFEYIKKDNKFDYAYMRKFASSLASDGYVFDDPKIELRKVSKEDQDDIVKSFITKIQSYFKEKRERELKEYIPVSKYNENGEKIDEIPFVNNKKYTL